MPRTLPLALILASCSLTAAAPAPQGALASLAWLAGCWEIRNGDTLIEEQWMRPGAGIMIGMSRAISAGTLREFEQVSIREEGDGLVYRAVPARQAPAEFRSVSMEAGRVTFENLQHDFPQRIVYRRGIAGDSLFASIEGPIDSRTRRVIEYPYGRVPCANP